MKKLRLPMVALPLLVLATGCTADSDDAGAMDDQVPAAVTPTLLDINESSDADLRGAGVPGAAAAILATEGPFDDMLAVDAALAGVLDEAGREAVYRVAWIPIDLNTASPEEILLIPGVGDRMTHEFEEYRPYTAMAQFRREIGKYVDDAEVDRLARYVMIADASD